MGVLNIEATRDPQKDDNKVKDQLFVKLGLSKKFFIYSFNSLNLSIVTFHFQITVTVPITLMTPMSESGQAIFPENHIHKIFSSISSNVEDVSAICKKNLRSWMLLFVPSDLLPDHKPHQQ